MKKKLIGTLVAMMLAVNLGVLPVVAADELMTQNSVSQALTVNGVTPYFNNICFDQFSKVIFCFFSILQG